MQFIEKYCLIIVAGIILLLSLFWLLFLNHVSMNQIGIAYNSINGEVVVHEHPGWYVTSPFTKVVNISTLPMLVTLRSSANVVNTKQVRFKPEGAKAYIKQQGFSYFDVTQDVLMGYAFSGNEYPFLEIMSSK